MFVSGGLRLAVKVYCYEVWLYPDYYSGPSNEFVYFVFACANH